LKKDKSLRILYYTIDRSQRVADLFEPIRRAIGQIAEVTTTTRTLDKTAGIVCQETTLKGRKLRPMVNPDIANEYDVVICDAMYAFLNERWEKVTVPKAVYWGDCHGKMVAHYIGRAYYDFDFSIFMPNYHTAASEHLPYIFDREVIWTPWAFDPEVFRDYHDIKRFPLLVTGVINTSVYPVRSRVHAACSGRSWCSVIRRPHENDLGDRWPCGADYASLLSSARIAVACSSIHRYLVSKYFEIPASGAMLLADAPQELADLGFERNIHYVEPPPKAGPFLADWVEELLRDSWVETVAENGHHLAHERHTIHHRAREVVDNLRRITVSLSSRGSS